MTVHSSERRGSVAPKNIKRQTFAQCFEAARQKFQDEVTEIAIKKDRKRAADVTRFLEGIKLADLEKCCKELGEKAEDKANNNAARLWTTLEELKGAADVFMEFAPESISIVWFGISSLITIGSARVQTKLLICASCDSIANIIGDCVRWEARMQKAQDNGSAPKLDIWDVEMPDLIFGILDFLWSARPHFDESRVKRLGSSFKDIFTKELQQKVDSLSQKYEEIVKKAQDHFEECVFEESLKTGQKLNQVLNDVKQYVSIGSDVVDAVRRSALRDELNRLQAKISNPASYKDHFNALKDRVDKIVRDRNGRAIAGWLFKESAYIDWKHNAKTSLICLRGPRGHGKSAAMMSAYREISTVDAYSPSVVICHFFFKKGDQDIQNSRTCLESILYQLLSSNELHNNMQALVSAVDALNPGFGAPESGFGGGSSAEFTTDIPSLCAAIRKIGEAIPNRVYIMVDALDECHDRQDHELPRHLKDLVKNQTDGLRVIISARDSIGIIEELGLTKDKTEDSKIDDQILPENIKVIDITSEKNSRDLEEYLQHDVGSLLRRRIDPQFSDFFNLELSRIVKIIHEKAKGDFTLARMILANLQQPSKDSLEKKVQRLPAAIGEIYMSSIEALSPDEQELVVSVLKWVVWTVSGITVIEISDHYREVYPKTEVIEANSNHSLKANSAEMAPDQNLNNIVHHSTITETADQGLITSRIMKFIADNPYQDPEIKDIIYHLENAGRDFFKFDRNTGIVGVDISIREWIQEDTIASRTKSTSREARGYNRYRDTNGNTVFKFTLTPSFVRYGESLTELFNKRDAHMSIALSIFRALNNVSFQEKYLADPILFDGLDERTPFDAQIEYFRATRNWRETDDFEGTQEWLTGLRKLGRRNKVSAVDNPNAKYRNTLGFPRYEIDHWHDHIKVLQTWWTEDSLGDSWWSDLLVELYIFLRPENWFRWRSKVFDADYQDENILFEHPLHTACNLGLHLLVDVILKDSKIRSRVEEAHPRQTSIDSVFEGLKPLSFIPTHCDPVRSVGLIGMMNTEQLIDYLSMVLVIDILTWQWEHRMKQCSFLFEALGSELRVAWLAYQKLNIPTISVDKLEFLYSLASEVKDVDLEDETPSGTGSWHNSWKDDVESFLQEIGNDKKQAAERLRLLIAARPRFNLINTQPLYDVCNPRWDTPLFISAPYPETLKCLLKHGANVNPESTDSYVENSDDGRHLQGTDWALKAELPPLPAILEHICDLRFEYLSEDMVQRYLQSAKILISKGARLDFKTMQKTSILHLASQIRNLELIKILCVSWDWDVHEANEDGWTPLHFLFKDRRPTDTQQIKEALDICSIIFKMRRGPDLVDAEDSQSQTPLAYAVRGGFKEGVQLLIDLKANVHDESDSGQNCFHQLAGCQTSDPETEIAIANILFDANVNCAKAADGIYPLTTAIENSKDYLIEFFLLKYNEIGKLDQRDNPLLVYDGTIEGTWLHILIKIGSFDSMTMVRLFKKFIEVLSDNVDAVDYVVKTNSDEETPLHLAAARKSGRNLIETIISINPDITRRDSNGYNALDILIKDLYKPLDHVRNVDELEELEEYRDLIYDQLETNYYARTSFSFLDTSIFDQDWSRMLEEILDLPKLFAPFCNSFKDEHGWSIYDVLHYRNRNDLICYLNPGAIGSKQTDFLYPSRLQMRLRGLTLSEDGLEAFATEDDIANWWFTEERRYGVAYTSMISDHPVPPVNKTFYFEMQRPEIWKARAKDGTYDSPRCTIGFESILKDELAIFYETDGGVCENDGNRNNFVSNLLWEALAACSGQDPEGPESQDSQKGPGFPEPEEIPELQEAQESQQISEQSDSEKSEESKDLEEEEEYVYCQTLEAPKIVGAGINPLTGAIFFTSNGTMLPGVWRARSGPRRYFPSFSLEYAPERFRVNFGGEAFAFGPANDPEWQWDETLDLEEILPKVKLTDEAFSMEVTHEESLEEED